MRSRRRQHRGFALVMAVTLVGLVAMTIGAMSVSFVNQSKRSERINGEAQLRQLLLAGTDYARARLSAGTAMDQAIALPESMGAQAAVLTLHDTSATADQRVVEIEAAVDGRKMSQSVKFSLRDGAWMVTGAELAG